MPIKIAGMPINTYPNPFIPKIMSMLVAIPQRMRKSPIPISAMETPTAINFFRDFSTPSAIPFPIASLTCFRASPGRP